MRRFVTEAFGSLDDLVVVEAPDLEPAPGQVVVDVEAAGVNFVDGLIVQGRYQFTPPLPHTPGTEVAGRIAAVGDGVDGLTVGQRVLALPSTGGYASQVVVPAPAAVPIPDSITAGQAAGLVQSYATMLYAFTRRTTVTAGRVDRRARRRRWRRPRGHRPRHRARGPGRCVRIDAGQARPRDGGRRGGDHRLRGRRPEDGDPRDHGRRRRRHRRPGRRRRRPSRRCAACAGRAATS